MELPSFIQSGPQGRHHVQGIALDQSREYLYFSFTTSLIKTDLTGRLVGSVRGLTGHLGCIALSPLDGKIYGSLEYKNDAIGQNIRKSQGREAVEEDSFYVVRFDGEKITRPDMDAQSDGVMECVALPTVKQDYQARVLQGGQVIEHRHGCSGIDGITFAPLPGTGKSGKLYFMVAYGIYKDLSRTDNDYQVIITYDPAVLDAYARPLEEDHLPRSGPDECLHKFFVYTGNTDWGVQNLEYDPFTGNLFLAVYPGAKPAFANRRLYVVDGCVAPVRQVLKGYDPPVQGEVLTLWGQGALPGFDFPYGSTGMISLGDGRFYFSREYRDQAGGQCSDVMLYHYNPANPLLFTKR
jgi:hypothetical protein